jgi:hypothetical protein
LGEWWFVAGGQRPVGAVRKIVGRLDGKNLDNSGNMNFFLVLKVEFLVV